MSLQLNNVTAGYTKVPVITDITFDVNPGEICGLIGLNGAGKSTTIKTIIGQLTPFSGRVEVEKLSILENQRGYRQSIAVIPESPVLYEELTFREHIEFVARSYNQMNEETMAHAMELVEAFRLTKQLDWFPAYFSKGMKQKVLIVCALMLDVPVYVVDEPFLGLDPLGIRTLLQVLKEKKEKGAAILMSTHVLDTAEKYCDRFIVLHEGKVIAQGDIEGLRATSNIEETSLEEIYFALTTGDDAHE
ncbi:MULTISPECIES: ABC transporter ATP-binding protein [Lactobacillales]|jgi:ABC superfamily ATP binding cassette transporter, ABC protein|uniref:ABC transporter ATP-binding protein n=1 Tax=Lactobacillales TaxID=186826 RepID=UPI0006606258|nr:MULTISPECIES: ABC transporter ATP-binding protein [Lactobacillales]MDK8381394.1 ABC transporter ATP-binding protein [Granulicatella sp. UMB5615B]MDK8523005.1 ABC transporter ATP-binding protein [Granulicatella sp. UMB5615A]